ncbi:MAG TPA: glycosyltransferase, partial [Thermoleophilaceae bacterium]|nr:glycosyltransferase [Thermoleophilaceae bacterium]
VAVTEHYTGFGRGLITGGERRLARFAFERADVVAPVSHELEGTLRELAPKANFVVVPNTVDTGAFEPPPERPEGLRLLNVAALAEKKGHRFLLEAMTRLPRATLQIVGDGELRSDLERQTRELGLTDRVSFLGEQPKHEVARLMREASLFVLPSLAENLPVVLIEAMASGLPSVATSVGGVPEMLGPEDGELVEPGDAGALAAGIRAAAGRDFDPAAMAGRARERWSYAAVSGRWTEIYEDLLSRRGSSSSATRRRTASSP